MTSLGKFVSVLARGIRRCDDRFSFKPQTQQGADILAEKLNAQVLMPDFFEPAEPWPVDKFPPRTDEEKGKLQAFFGGPAKPQDAVSKLINVGKELKAEGAKWVGTFGFCWGTHYDCLAYPLRTNQRGDTGGKVTILAGSAESTPFDAVAAVHPA